MPHRVWDPSAGEAAAPQQIPPAPPTVHPDGSVSSACSVGSEGPCATEVGGGAGGAPDGRSVPIYKVCWD
jgi:hypothetical protein